jgi:hypothetical protein
MKIEKVIVTGTVYPSNILDSDKETVDSESLVYGEKHFMSLINKGHLGIDVEHNEIASSSSVAKSWIKKNDDNLVWKMTTEITDPDLIQKVLKGELNGYSMAGKARIQSSLEEVEVKKEAAGLAVSSNDHMHVALVGLNSSGRVIKGYTNRAKDGHFHEIKSGTVTEPSGEDGHTHPLWFDELA